ncbi:hypothetical protein BDZ91DRAFT_817444 [Kalaharituber pfeilii]|nr:hypothetical protein BDZ91DRAFT_817444 [Kalaharituber pfeilii]
MVLWGGKCDGCFALSVGAVAVDGGGSRRSAESLKRIRRTATSSVGLISPLLPSVKSPPGAGPACCTLSKLLRALRPRRPWAGPSEQNLGPPVVGGAPRLYAAASLPPERLLPVTSTRPAGKHRSTAAWWAAACVRSSAKQVDASGRTAANPRQHAAQVVRLSPASGWRRLRRVEPNAHLSALTPREELARAPLQELYLAIARICLCTACFLERSSSIAPVRTVAASPQEVLYLAQRAISFPVKISTLRLWPGRRRNTPREHISCSMLMKKGEKIAISCMSNKHE